MLSTRLAGRTRVAASYSAIALTLAAGGLAACGESSQDKAEKARAEVCQARKVISEEVTKLQALPLTTSSLEPAKTGLEKISAELHKMQSVQGNLSPERKEQVEKATSKFGEEVKVAGLSVASALTSGTSQAALEAAKPKVKAALETLASEYRQALGPVSCQ